MNRDCLNCMFFAVESDLSAHCSRATCPFKVETPKEEEEEKDEYTLDDLGPNWW